MNIGSKLFGLVLIVLFLVILVKSQFDEDGYDEDMTLANVENFDDDGYDNVLSQEPIFDESYDSPVSAAEENVENLNVDSADETHNVASTDKDVENLGIASADSTNGEHPVDKMDNVLDAQVNSAHVLKGGFRSSSSRSSGFRSSSSRSSGFRSSSSYRSSSGSGSKSSGSSGSGYKSSGSSGSKSSGSSGYRSSSSYRRSSSRSSSKKQTVYKPVRVKYSSFKVKYHSMFTYNRPYTYNYNGNQYNTFTDYKFGGEYTYPEIMTLLKGHIFARKTMKIRYVGTTGAYTYYYRNVIIDMVTGTYYVIRTDTTEGKTIVATVTVGNTNSTDVVTGAPTGATNTLRYEEVANVLQASSGSSTTTIVIEQSRAGEKPSAEDSTSQEELKQLDATAQDKLSIEYVADESGVGQLVAKMGIVAASVLAVLFAVI